METNMITATIDGDEILPPRMSTDRSAAGLRSLMRDWERDSAVDEEENENELMVLLSEMVSVPPLGDA
jgi:hypothetical protein